MRIPHRSRRRPAGWTIRLKDLDRLLLPFALGAAAVIFVVVLFVTGWPFRF